MKNQDVRQEIKDAGLFLWQIAEALGMRDDSFSRSLRKEFSAERKAEIRKVITE